VPHFSLRVGVCEMQAEHTRRKFTQDSGMRVGVSKAGIRRSPRSTAARSSAPS